MLFLYLYNVGSKKGHKATTHNCVPLVKILWVFVRSTPCSSYICVIKSIMLPQGVLRMIAFLTGTMSS